MAVNQNMFQLAARYVSVFFFSHRRIRHFSNPHILFNRYRCGFVYYFGAVVAFAWIISEFASADDQLRVVQRQFTKNIQPLLQSACGDCHSGEEAAADFNLDRFQTLDQLLAARKQWHAVEQRVVANEMPPADAPPLSESDRQSVVDWLNQLLHSADCKNIDPGRVTVRRLNRTEYRNTIRDLIGVDYQPAADFPGDDVGYGFDNIADVLSLPPILMEKYLTAAEEISRQANFNDAPLRLDLEKYILSPADIGFRMQIPADDSNAIATKHSRDLLQQFAIRAYRRPVTRAEVDQLMALFQSALDGGDSVVDARRLPLQAVLVSPHFLYKIETPSQPGEIRPLNDFELATSLSYFLWSTMPDNELFQLAGRAKLHDEKVICQQVDRMLADPKSSALIDNFVTQWLQLGLLETIQPDPELFPAMDSALRKDLITETKMLVADLVRQDSRITAVLESDFTFVNQRLADFYGIKGVEGEQFRKVATIDAGRVGLLTQASILTLTSNPTRTSPVKRGKWIMENLLGEVPPPPDPKAMKLEDQTELTGTLRQRMEQHRADPNCATCHKVMDELGFALENYDAIGRWREQDENQPIDASGILPDGTRFSGASQMQQIIRTQMSDKFVRCLTEKMLIYATGRGLEYFDECAVDKIIETLQENDYRFSTLIQAVASSDPFLKRRGESE